MWCVSRCETEPRLFDANRSGDERKGTESWIMSVYRFSNRWRGIRVVVAVDNAVYDLG